jgi:hypothetical protein
MPSSWMLRRVALVRIDVHPKRRFLQKLHGVTFQKAAFFIVTDVITSNLTYILLNPYIYIFIYVFSLYCSLGDQRPRSLFGSSLFFAYLATKRPIMKQRTNKEDRKMYDINIRANYRQAFWGNITKYVNIRKRNHTK